MGLVVESMFLPTMLSGLFVLQAPTSDVEVGSGQMGGVERAGHQLYGSHSCKAGHVSAGQD